jgi:hypothetical protein
MWYLPAVCLLFTWAGGRCKVSSLKELSFVGILNPARFIFLYTNKSILSKVERVKTPA